MSNPADPTDAYDVLIEKKIHEAIQFEEDRRFRQLKWIIVGLGILGAGTLGTIATVYVDKAIDARIGQLTDQASLFRFMAMAGQLSNGAKLSDEQKSSVMKLMRRIADNKDLRDAPDTSLAVVDVFKRIVQTNDAESASTIFELFKPQILSSQRGIQSALHHYGQRINSVNPSVNSASLNDDLKRFEQAEYLASSLNQEELALSYRALYQLTHTDFQPDKAYRATLARVTGLKEADRARFFDELAIRTVYSNWQNFKGADGLEFQRRARLFYATLAKTSGLPEALSSTLAQIGEHGCEKKQCEAVAAELARPAVLSQITGVMPPSELMAADE